MTSNVAVIALTNANVTLSTPPNSGASWAGPYQSQSAILRFTGTLSGNCTITLPRPGFWIVENLCTVGAFYVALASSAPGQIICAPPGEATNIYCDGTNVKFINLGRVGEYLDLSASAVPAWITNCTVPPYLNCDGSTFSAVTYPTLSTYLGGTTLPDLRGRSRAALNQTTNRITTAGSGINGDVILSAGGTQNQTLTTPQLPSHNHTATDSGHTHTINSQLNGSVNPALNSGGTLVQAVGGAQSGTGFANITVGNTGSGNPFAIMNPVTISGLTLVRAG